MPWHSMPESWPTTLTTYWVRIHWWQTPFQAIFIHADGELYWAVETDVPDEYTPIPWFLATRYRDL